MTGWWGGALAALVVAVLAGVGDWQRSRRRDLDRIGLADWRTLQVAALIAAAGCAIIAQHGGIGQ